MVQVVFLPASALSLSTATPNPVAVRVIQATQDQLVMKPAPLVSLGLVVRVYASARIQRIVIMSLETVTAQLAGMQTTVRFHVCKGGTEEIVQTGECRRKNFCTGICFSVMDWPSGLVRLVRP